jgi:hypothetical protein
MSGLSHLELHKNQRVGLLPDHVSGLLDFTSLLLHYNFLNNDSAILVVPFTVFNGDNLC